MTEGKDRRYTIDECKEIFFENFFQDTEYKNKIITLADFPETPECGLEIDYKDLEKYFEDGEQTIILGELFDSPQRILSGIEMAINDLLHPDQRGKVTIHPRPINLPKDREKSLSEIRQIDIGELIRFSGRIKKIRQNTPKIVMGAFMCLRCGAIIKEPQPMDSFIRKDPLQCYKDQGGCDRASTTTFELLSELSDYRDLQIVYLEEMYDADNPHQPQTKRVFLWDDLAGINPINDVIINCIVKTFQIKKTSVPEVYLEAVSIEFPEDYYSAISLSEEDKKEISELMHRPDIYDLYVESIAPTITGYRNIKLAIALALFGGVDKDFGDEFYRGKINILIIGDPSTAKSKILQYTQKLAPKAIYGSGEGATGVGLTFACVKDEIDNTWVIESGLLPMANKGVAIIDEIDKMDKKDTDRLHTAMESGIMPYSKAGLVGTLLADCTLIAGGNPQYGRFESNESMIGQIDLPAPLISRFDLVFGVKDENTDLDGESSDNKICDHILSIHTGYKDKDFLIAEPPIIPKSFRKIVLLSKEIKPELTTEAMSAIKKFFLELRGGQSEDLAPASWRQLHGLVRLTEGYARGRLSDIANVEDANNVIELVKASLYSSCHGDIDLLTTGMKKGQRERLRLYHDFIKENEAVTLPEILEFAEANEIDKDTCKTDIEKLEEVGRIYSIKGLYKIT
jgi:replicative DNA helicase Mcm